MKRFVSLQFLMPKTVGRPPWTEDQPAARPLPTNKHGIKAANIHAFIWIRNHDTSLRANADISCLRQRGHGDRQINLWGNE
jgi:hypothetical protein